MNEICGNSQTETVQIEIFKYIELFDEGINKISFIYYHKTNNLLSTKFQVKNNILVVSFIIPLKFYFKYLFSLKNLRRFN